MRIKKYNWVEMRLTEKEAKKLIACLGHSVVKNKINIDFKDEMIKELED